MRILLRIGALLLTLVLFTNPVRAVQQDTGTTIIPIPEYVITAQRSKTPNIYRPESISKMTGTDQHLVSATSTPDALSAIPGVWMQRTNLGGGSPFVRGLTGYHTLIMIDGIRFNNSTFRSGPNQYLNTIDPFLLDNIEVMNGQGSVPYGSDALGGVIQVFTKSPAFTAAGRELKASIFSKYMSGGMESAGRAELETGFQKTAIRLGVSFRKLGDVVAGDGLGTLSPTGYSETSADAKFLRKFKANHLLTGCFNFHQQNKVPLYHKIAGGDYSAYSFDPQQRLLSYVRLESSYESLIFSRVLYTLSYQNSLERRIKQKTASAIRDIEEDGVSTVNGTLEVWSEPLPFWTISSGIEIYTDFIRSNTQRLNDSISQSVDQRGLYPDRSRSENFALFSLHSMDLGRLSLVFGGRYNLIRLSVKDELLGDTEISPSALIGNAGVNFKASQQVRLVASVSSGFRAPNINDVSSLGIADFRYEIPNYELNPETSLNLDVGMKIDYPRFSANFFVFRNKLDNLITNVRSTYHGKDSIDGFQVYQRKNLNKAMIQGFEAFGSYSVTSFLKLLGNISYTHGQDLQTGDPLRRIPPLNSRLSTRYSHKKFSAMIEWVYAGEQTRLSHGDMDDDRIQEGGTPEWNTLDISLRYSGGHYEVNAGVLNVLNEAYRYHGSGIDGRGRSFWVSLRIFNSWYR